MSNRPFAPEYARLQIRKAHALYTITEEQSLQLRLNLGALFPNRAPRQRLVLPELLTEQSIGEVLVMCAGISIKPTRVGAG